MSTGASSKENGAYFQAIRPGPSQRIAFAAASAQSVAFKTSPRTTLISVFATQDCWVRVGQSGVVAAVNDGHSMFLPGGIKDFIGVDETISVPVISVIQDGSAGYLHVCECVDSGVPM